MTDVIHLIHSSRPPLSSSQSFPMNEIPAGGSVTRESIEFDSIEASFSKQSPFKSLIVSPVPP